MSLADPSIEETPGLTAGRRWDVARQDAKDANVIHIHAERLAFIFKSWACRRTFILLVTVTLSPFVFAFLWFLFVSDMLLKSLLNQPAL